LSLHYHHHHYHVEINQLLDHVLLISIGQDQDQDQLTVQVQVLVHQLVQALVPVSVQGTAVVVAVAAVVVDGLDHLLSLDVEDHQGLDLDHDLGLTHHEEGHVPGLGLDHHIIIIVHVHVQGIVDPGLDLDLLHLHLY
jgi:hypothetical protein